jgi:hypothetical protein
MFLDILMYGIKNNSFKNTKYYFDHQIANL